MRWGLQQKRKNSRRYIDSQQNAEKPNTRQIKKSTDHALKMCRELRKTDPQKDKFRSTNKQVKK